MDFAKASGLTLKESGVVEVDRFSLETSRSKFYAGGDVISGASNVSNAMGYGKKAARNIDERLMGVKRFGQLMRTYDYDQTPPAQPSEAGRQIPDNVPARERVTNFDEVSLGLTAIEALEEANRCLRCDIRATDR
jgi:NADPH-dependent glutamate synthase beta subunit-like oxidoreductase